MRALLIACVLAGVAGGQPQPGGSMRAIPRMQAVPEPYDQISFRRDEKEITRYHFGPSLRRPFLYPILGPSGRTLTRMGHPGDPLTHSHHNSIWIAYGKVNDVDFWADSGQRAGRIIHQGTFDIEDGDERAGVLTQANWTGPDGAVLLRETRETWVYGLADGEWMLVIDLSLDAAVDAAVFENAGFGPIGVRVAKSMAVYFGGGRLRNSEGGEGEPQIFRKPARWVDYAGQVTDGVVEGLTLMDHPTNLNHPSPFHVREDGWMGAMLSTSGAVTIRRGKPLHLRYGVYVHRGVPALAQLAARWEQCAKLDLHPPYGPPVSARDCLHGGHRKFNRPRKFESTSDCVAFVEK